MLNVLILTKIQTYYFSDYECMHKRFVNIINICLEFKDGDVFDWSSGLEDADDSHLYFEPSVGKLLVFDFLNSNQVFLFLKESFPS